jgi:hypothetical protein
MKKITTLMTVMAVAGLTQATTIEQAPICVETSKITCPAIEAAVEASQAAGIVVRDDLTDAEKLLLIKATEATEAPIADVKASKASGTVIRVNLTDAEKLILINAAESSEMPIADIKATPISK